MNIRKLIISLILITLPVASVFFISWQSNDQEKLITTENNNISLVSKTNQMDDSQNNQSPKYYANLQDVAKASTNLFPIYHTVENGQEWIKAVIEDYMVLAYTEPPLKSTDIYGIQKILRKLKFFQGEIDGIYGIMTMEAVKNFQTFCGITPTGVMDLDDYNLLAELYEEITPAKTVGKPQGKIVVLIVLDERTLYILDDNKIFYKFPIAIGKVETPSPIGSWKIVSKDSWGEGFGTRWLGINVPYGRFGIHGTNKPWSIGSAESGGCIRMFNYDVEILAKLVNQGTPVHIVGGNFPYNLPWRTVKDGDRGSDVWAVQNRLRELGYSKNRPDSIYGRETSQGVLQFQKDHGLEPTGKVDLATLQKMGLYLFQ